MPLFGKSKEQKVTEAMEALSTLSARVTAWATVVVRSLAESEELGVGDPTVKWRVHTEVLGLLCHLVNRWSVEVGGPTFRDGVLDRVVPHVVDGVVDSTWTSPPGTGQGPGYEEWSERMKAELLHNINVAGGEYAECTSVMGPAEQSRSWAFRDDNVLGRFAGNITRLADCDPIERITAALGALGAVTDPMMRRDIEAVRRNAR